MRKKIIIGNWKMNNTVDESLQLIRGLKESIVNVNCDVVVCPSFISLDRVSEELGDSCIKLGAQNVHFAAQGAYTGEISCNMLKSIKVSFVILGHSERRQYFGETNTSVNKRARAAVDANFVAVICVGESLEQRNFGLTEVILRRQTKSVLNEMSAENIGKIIIAYEPLWAIGTGRTAALEQVRTACSIIRRQVEELYGNSVADELRTLYGGSLNENNVNDLLSLPNIDGGLVGNASLNADKFSAIVRSASDYC